MTETLSTGVRRSLLTDLPADPVGPSPSPPGESAKDVGGRSLQIFAGVWVRNGIEHGSATPTKPVIDWTEVEASHEQKKKAVFGASAQKTSWLQRFLLHMGREGARPHDHGIEVVLPGKKK